MYVCPQTFAVYECLSDWGETLCAASPNPATIITAGTSAAVCVWDVEVRKDKVAHMKLRQVSLCLCLTLKLHFQTKTLTRGFFTAAVRSHRLCDVSGCVGGPQHDCERLPGPHLHPVGHGGAELHHSVNRALNQHLRSGCQRPHCKLTFSIVSDAILPLLSSQNLPLASLSSVCHFWLSAAAFPFHPLAVGMKQPSLLTACTSSSRVFCSSALVFVSIRAHRCQHHITLSKGEIASCAGPVLYLWSMKGQLLTRTDASCGPRPDILCVCFTQLQEWDPKNVIISGCADGIVRVRMFWMAVHIIPPQQFLLWY